MTRFVIALLVLVGCSPGAIDDCQPPPFMNAAIAGGLQGTPHPGMADVYSFTVDLRFDASHALIQASVTPIVRTAGAI